MIALWFWSTEVSVTAPHQSVGAAALPRTTLITTAAAAAAPPPSLQPILHRWPQRHGESLPFRAANTDGGAAELKNS